MEAAYQHNLILIESCGNYTAYAQMDTITGTGGDRNCFYPQLMALDRIHDEYPNATFIFMFRDVDKWINSVIHFRNGQLGKRLQQCSKNGEIPFLQGNSPKQLRHFWCNTVKHARKFISTHPSHQYYEIDIDHPNTGEQLSKIFHIDDSKCWGTHNVNTKLHSNNATVK